MCDFSRQMAHGGTAVERNCELMNVLLDCNKNGDVTSGFVTSYQQVRISHV